MKKLVSLLLGATLMVGVLAACGSTPSSAPAGSTASAKTSTPASGDKVTVRMTYWNSEETMADLLAYLETAVPDVKVEYQFIDNTNYATIVDTQLAAGEGPDIIVEAANSALKHARLGYLEDVTVLSEKFSDAGNAIFTYEGSVYALPGVSWFEGIWYNKDLFTENNIELPKTFDEYIAVCKKFEGIGIKPLAAGLKSWEPMLKNSMAFVTAEYLTAPEGKGFGEKYRNGETALNGTWNTYIEKWSEMITEGVYTQDMTGIDHEQAMEEFTSGKAAMFCSGPWDLEAILAKNPDLNLDMMPFYGTQPSDGWMIGGPGGGFAVNANSKEKEAAMKVLEAIATPEAQKALVANNEGGSSYLVGLDTGLPQYYNGVETTIKAGNIFCPWDEWGAAGGAHQDYGVEFQKYLMGEQDIATTLANVDVVVEELLAK
ncbi:extracellular solute-binding protein [Ruminococcaceae bacterium OttesenSCG-928-A16]|nr:extracellular solute-binding protein [Ruminococcaceae bacterium OttesenSCG-928-A16]